MGRTNDKPIKEAIEQLLKVYKLKSKFDETSLVVAWPEMMGKAIANRTKDTLFPTYYFSYRITPI